MSNEIYFTRNTRRAGRIGDTMVVVTEGARITITLQPNGQPAKVTVAKAKPATPATAPATPAKVTPATKRQSNVARRKEVLTRMRAQARATR